jgi:hypothetical protein
MTTHDRMHPATAQAVALFADDRTAPGPFRADLADWVARYETARGLLEHLRATGTRARQELDAAKRAAPLRLTGALAGGKVAPELIGAELPALRQAVDTAEDRYSIAVRAAQHCLSEIQRAVYGRHHADLLGWIAEQRSALPWHEPCPAHLSVAWTAISRRYQITLPYEACTYTRDGSPSTVQPHLRLVLNTADPTPGIGHSYDRHYWAWQCIAHGQTVTATTDRQTRIRIAGDWDQRLPLAPAPTAHTRSGLFAARAQR